MIAQREERLRTAEKTFAQREEMLHSAEGTIAQREERLRSEESRSKTISSEFESKSEEYRRMQISMEREKADLEDMKLQRETLAREIEQMKAMAGQNAQEGGSGEDQDITRLFMLQEERLKKAAQAGGPAGAGNAAPGMLSPIQNQAQSPEATGMLNPIQSPADLGLPSLNAAPMNAPVTDTLWDLQPSPGFMPQPAAGPANNPAPSYKQETSSADMVQNYINKQRGAVIGKTLTINITDNSGNILVSAGTVITDQIFDMVCAQRRDAIIELAMYAR